MAGKASGKFSPVATKAATAGLKPDPTGRKKSINQRTDKKRKQSSLLLGEAMELASTYDIAIKKGSSIVDVLQDLLDRLMDKWRFVCKKVDSLEESEWLVSRNDEVGNKLVEPNVWIQYEATLRAELMDLAIRMGHLGVDERRVRVQEAQVEILGRAVLAAAQAIGLDNALQRQLGAALREQLILLESGRPDPASIKPNGSSRAPVLEGKARAA